MIIEMILKAVIGLPLIFFIPGYIMFSALAKEKLEKLDFSEVVFLQILGSVLVSGWIGLTLAELGYFSLVNLLILLVVFSGLLGWKYKVKFNLELFPKPKLDYKSMALIIILLIAVGLFFQPFEYIFGGADAGVYINTGINIATTGSIIIQDDFLSKIPNDVRQLTYGLVNNPQIKYEGILFPGFYITDYSNGTVVPQFFHLYPVWIAIFYTIFGFSSFLYVTPIFAILAICAVYFSSKKMFNDNVAIIASFLLVINLQEIWSARMSLTEILMQFLVFSAIYAFILYNENNNKLFLFLSVFCMGEALLTRVDAIFLLIVLPFMVLYVSKINRDMLLFSVTFLFLFLQSAIHAIFISTPYTFDVYLLGGRNLNAWHVYSFLTVFVILSILGGWGLSRINIRGILYQTNVFGRLAHKDIQKYVKIVVSVLILIIFVYLYFFRPNISTPETIMIGNTVLRTYNEDNLLRLGWYFSPFGLLLGLIGTILLIQDKLDKKTLIFVILAASQIGFFTWKISNNPFHIYAFRRYLPIAIPAITIIISYTIFKIWEFNKFGKISKLMAISIFLILSIQLINISIPMVHHKEYDGAIEQVREISSLFDDDSIVFLQSGEVSHCLGTPLTFMYKKKCLVIKEDVPITDYNYPHQKKYLITKYQSEIPTPLEKYNLVEINDILIETPVFEKSYTILPRNVQTFKMAISIYEIK